MKARTTRAPLFTMGQLLSTPGALAACTPHGDVLMVCLGRHLRGDWGDLSAGDHRANDDALKDGSRIFSAYQVAPDLKLWIITEAADEQGHRVATTVLLPSEY